MNSRDEKLKKTDKFIEEKIKFHFLDYGFHEFKKTDDILGLEFVKEENKYNYMKGHIVSFYQKQYMGAEQYGLGRQISFIPNCSRFGDREKWHADSPTWAFLINIDENKHSLFIDNGMIFTLEWKCNNDEIMDKFIEVFSTFCEKR